MSDLTSMDFFGDVAELIEDPYPYFEALRAKCPVLCENHHGVTMVTGWQESVDVYNDTRAFSSCILVTGRGIHSCPGAPLARAETRVGLERLLDRTSDIRISETEHGPANDRRYEYIPTYILRGLAELHVEFTPVVGATR